MKEEMKMKEKEETKNEKEEETKKKVRVIGGNFFLLSILTFVVPFSFDRETERYGRVGGGRIN